MAVMNDALCSWVMRNGQQPLTDEMVAEIKRLRSEGQRTGVIANALNVSPQTVRKYAGPYTPAVSATA